MRRTDLVLAEALGGNLEPVEHKASVGRPDGVTDADGHGHRVHNGAAVVKYISLYRVPGDHECWFQWM